MLRFYAVIFDGLLYMLFLLSVYMLLVFRKKRKVQIIVLLSAVTIFFSCFSVFMSGAEYKRGCSRKIWDTLSALEFGEPRPDINQVK